MRLKRVDEVRSGGRRCPECDAELDRVRFRTIDLDRCPAGHGVWFDAGELDSVAKGRRRPETRLDDPPWTTAPLLPCPLTGRPTLREGCVDDLLFRGCTECGGFFLRLSVLQTLAGRSSRSGVNVDQVSVSAGEGLLQAGLEFLVTAPLRILG